MSVRAVRPDLNEAVERIASEAGSTGDRTRVKRRSIAADFDAINAALFGAREAVPEDEPKTRESADDYLTAGSLEGAPD